jgi:molybdate transport system ATP-binding protein
VTAGLAVDGRVDRGTFTLSLTARVEPGEVLAVLGPNGAGKSTLLRALAGLVPLTEGSIRLGDAVLDDAATDTWVPADRRPVGIVFQDYRLFPHLDVRDNVAFAPRSRGVGRAESRRAA